MAHYSYLKVPGIVSVHSQGAFLLDSLLMIRWLIDIGRDEEGMRVLADLHGGDLENRVAKAEFREIKDTVLADVGGFLQDCIFDRDIKSPL